jgi:hypothetical protein
MRLRPFATALLAALCLTATAQAASLAGVTLSDQTTVDGQSLALNGLALRSKAVFKVYVAGLYLPAEQADAAAILGADAPRQMVMHFVRSVGADKVNEGWSEGLAANTPGAGADLKAAFDQLMKAMEDVEEGDRLTFTYVPGKGTTINVKGKDKGTIEGKAFADALLACWLGPKPGPGEDFKQALLGR